MSTTAGPLALSGGSFYFRPEADGLGQAQVQHKVTRASFGVDGQKPAGGSRGIEGAQGSAVDGTRR